MFISTRFIQEHYFNLVHFGMTFLTRLVICHYFSTVFIQGQYFLTHSAQNVIFELIHHTTLFLTCLSGRHFRSCFVPGQPFQPILSLDIIFDLFHLGTLVRLALLKDVIFDPFWDDILTIFVPRYYFRPQTSFSTIFDPGFIFDPFRTREDIFSLFRLRQYFRPVESGDIILDRLSPRILFSTLSALGRHF